MRGARPLALPINRQNEVITPEELVRNAVAERGDLEFKRDLPGNSQREKAEMLKDVSAMANSGGGLIYYGVEEDKGVAVAVAPSIGANADAEIRRIAQTLESGIEPRLTGIQIEPLQIEGGLVLVVEVPPAFSGPCRRVQDGQSKFFLRSHTHVAEMSYDQLRGQFQRSGEAFRYARETWRETISRVSQRNTWRPIIEGPVCLTQLIPISSALSSVSIDVKSLRNRHDLFMQPDWGGCSGRFNLDGVVLYPGLRDEEATVFVQVHRNGVVESCRTGKALYYDGNIIPSQTVAEFYRNSYKSLANFSREQNLQGPFLFNCALLGVTEYQLALEGRYFLFEKPTSDRDELIFPEIYFEHLPDPDDEGPIKDTLDIMWQAFGIESCNYYSPDGAWLAK